MTDDGRGAYDASMVRRWSGCLFPAICAGAYGEDGLMPALGQFYAFVGRDRFTYTVPVDPTAFIRLGPPPGAWTVFVKVRDKP